MNFKIIISIFFLQFSYSQNHILVPKGNIAKEPIISDATFSRIAKRNNLSDKSFGAENLQKLDTKFQKVVLTLKEQNVFHKIKYIAPKYGISPESIAACIIGEHVFNVGLVDTFQSHFISVYSKWIQKHHSVRDIYLKFLSQPDVQSLLKNKDLSDYERFDQIFSLYNTKYRGREDYPDANFLMTFFNPYGAGLTYGLGQLSPVRVLLTNDIAVQYGGMPKIDPRDTESLYNAVLDIDSNIHYIAASVVAEINNYKEYSNFDISNNIGIIATLYNLGAEKSRAKQLKTKNDQLVKNNKEIQYPQENFYGWYMNRQEKEIAKLVH